MLHIVRYFNRHLQRRAWVISRCVGLGGWCALILWFIASLALAQDVEPAASKSDGTKSATERKPNPLDLHYLEGPDGKPVFVPGVTLQEYLDWLAQRPVRERPAPLAASVTSLTLDGASEEERVQLAVRIEIQITAENEWVRVPLELKEATLRATPIHTGPGDALPAPYHPESGHSWWIRGRGQHELNLSCGVPIRRQGLHRRIQLALPPTAVSALKLRVPHPRATGKVPEKTTLTARSAGSQTEFEVLGLGNRLDLAWQPVLESAVGETLLEAITSVSATLVDGETATLEASQRIGALGQQGLFETVRVTLPPGAELLRIDSPDYQEHHTDAANPNQVFVRLKKPTAGPVDLRWTVRSRLPPVGETFVIEGFEVDRARLHTGFLSVSIVGDFGIVRESNADKFLQRINLADLPVGLRQGQAGFRFLNRLRLGLKLERVEPYVAVEPTMFLRFSPDTLELDATFAAKVSRGTVKQLRFRWPGWKRAGWNIEGFESTDRIEPRIEEDSADPDGIRLEFGEPIRDSVELRLQARRPISESTLASVSLPAIETSRQTSPLIAILTPDNLKVSLEPAPQTTLRSVADTLTRIKTPREWQQLGRMDYRAIGSQTAFSAKLTVYPQEITATTNVEAVVKRGIVTVRQKFAYYVAHERLDRLRFALPAEFQMGRVRFYLPSGDELNSERLPGDASPVELSILLEKPQLGRFEIEARYSIPPGVPETSDADAAFVIPLVQSRDAPCSTTRFQWHDGAGPEAIIVGTDWLSQPSTDGSLAWILPRDCAEVSLEFSHTGVALKTAVVAKALIRSTISEDGSIRTRSSYRLAPGVSDLVIAFPPGVQPVGAWWNRERVRLTPNASSSDAALQYTLSSTERSVDSAALVTLDVVAPRGAAWHFSGSYELITALFPQSLAATEVMWDVSLPAKVHLFTLPEGVTAAFEWRRKGLFWSRETELTALTQEKWIGAEDGLVVETAEIGTNRYLFLGFGSPPVLEFQCMSQAGIVLIGAGAALILGLLLVKLPHTRNVLTFLSMGFSVALLTVWFRAPVLVLVQPAILGLVLAVFAAGLDSFVKRRTRSVAITLSSPSSFMTPVSSHARGKVAGIGSNEFTAIRPPEPVRDPAENLSESGRRA